MCVCLCALACMHMWLYDCKNMLCSCDLLRLAPLCYCQLSPCCYLLLIAPSARSLALALALVVVEAPAALARGKVVVVVVVVVVVAIAIASTRHHEHKASQLFSHCCPRCHQLQCENSCDALCGRRLALAITSTMQHEHKASQLVSHCCLGCKYCSHHIN